MNRSFKSLTSSRLCQRVGYVALIIFVSAVGLAIICVVETVQAIVRAVASEWTAARKNVSEYWKEGAQ